LIPASLAESVPSAVLSVPQNLGGGGLREPVAPLVELRRFVSPVGLQPYQRSLIQGVLSAVSTHVDEHVAGLMCLPTGAGKTICAASVALAILRATGRSAPHVLWVAQQGELLHQARSSFERLWWNGDGPASLDLEFLDQRRWRSFTKTETPAVGFITAAMLSRIIDGDGLAMVRLQGAVFDEAHHLGAVELSRNWSAVRSRIHGGGLALGISATPDRNEFEDFSRLLAAFDSRLWMPSELMPRPISALRRLGMLATTVTRLVPGVPAYAMAKSGDSRRQVRSGAAWDPERWSAAIRFARDYRGRLAVFAPDTAWGALFARHLRFSGVEAEFVDGDDSPSVRAAVLGRFRDGRTRVLVNAQLFIEGVDIPACDGVLICYPTTSKIRIAQMIGRAMRGPLVGGNEQCEVFCLDPLVLDLVNSLVDGQVDQTLWSEVALLTRC
jgi:superfamily II DNA or RNA helicase